MAGTLTVQNLQGPSSGANANKILIPSGQTLDVSGGTLTPSAGQIVQVVSTSTQSLTSISGTSFAQYSALDTIITPTSTSSKIFVDIRVCVGQANDDNYIQFRANRLIGATSTDIGLGTSSGNSTLTSWTNNGPYTHAIYETHSSSWSYLDSPSTTSQITYRLFARPMATTSRTMYFNRPSDNGDANRGTTTSSMTLMEIAQ